MNVIMKKIKFLMLAMLAIMASMTFTACDDDDDNNASNYQKYQETVNNIVKSQKKSDKVILLVAFGLPGSRLTTPSTRWWLTTRATSAVLTYICHSLPLSVSTTHVTVRTPLRKTTTILSTGSPLSVWQAIARWWYSHCR